MPTSQFHTQMLMTDEVIMNVEQCLAKQAAAVVQETNGMKTVEDTGDRIDIKTSSGNMYQLLSLMRAPF